MKILQLDLATNRQQELVGLATQLQTDAENVQKAALICFSDLEACVSNTNQVLANVAYDRKIIEPNPFTDGLLVYYPFNTNALDESGNDNNGKIHGASLAEDRFGKKNSAYSFDGVSNKIVVRDAPLLNFGKTEFSIGVWIKTTQTGIWKRIVTKRAHINTGNWYSLAVLNGKANFEIYAGGNLGSISNVNDGHWHLLFITRNLFNFSMYIDGNIESTMVDEGRNLNSGMNTPLEIGIWATESYGGTFNGLMDDIRIYNRALSDSEIQQLYNNASNQTKNCKAKLLDRKLEIPCVSVPNVVGTAADIYSLEMINTHFKILVWQSTISTPEV
ncbi:LamG domain-containing protein [Candidatus Marithrix sp. Canyon 246]|uniref:LamG domain-containing protein n=1 Tax=Candidatus Marithrix sp. Canyon 246 TaxID=1827136 RepID=UPI00084A0ABE|nr:LamG domain-containing protein [Candidatus Marithrix sp. Canyon 246]